MSCIAALALLVLAGCGSSDNGSSNTSTSTGSSSQTTGGTADTGGPDAAAATADGKKAGETAADGRVAAAPVKTIAFLNYTSQASALRRVSAGMKDAAAALGWNYQTCDAQGQPQKVADCAATLLQKKVDVMGSTAIPVALDKPQMEQAKSDGVPWLNVGGENPVNSLFTGSFFVPEAELYKPLHDELFSRIGDGEAEIGAIQLTVDDTARLRYEALEDELKAHPDVSVAANVEGTPANPGAVTAATVAMLRQHPRIKAIWSCCDIFTSYIVQGIKQAGMTGDDKPIVLAPFPDQSMLQLVRDGDVTVVIELPWEAYGWIAVDEAVQHFAHDTPFTEHGRPSQYPDALYGGQIVTEENVQSDPDKLQPPVYDYAAYFKAKWKAEFGG
ncbi:MAG TPA: substrate-binding domain-containing protein [Conexibacter sp.]|nr:substrate-binding domain-containing protein [Conexibacter sp.]